MQIHVKPFEDCGCKPLQLQWKCHVVVERRQRELAAGRRELQQLAAVIR